MNNTVKSPTAAMYEAQISALYASAREGINTAGMAISSLQDSLSELDDTYDELAGTHEDLMRLSSDALRQLEDMRQSSQTAAEGFKILTDCTRLLISHLTREGMEIPAFILEESRQEKSLRAYQEGKEQPFPSLVQ